MSDVIKLTERRIHYAWVVAAVTFMVLLVTAGIRATREHPGPSAIGASFERDWTNSQDQRRRVYPEAVDAVPERTAEGSFAERSLP